MVRRVFFFSWQSDTPGKTGHYLIRDALTDASKAVSTEIALDEPDREGSIEVDSDTRDVPGHPPIFDTILRKIEDATAFVADFTFVGGRPGRLIPNPNVATEYGYALKVLGHGRMILVMNAAYGDPETELLPFDMRHFTRPVRFNLPDDATPQEIAAERKKLGL